MNIVVFWFISYVGYRALQGVTDYTELQGITMWGERGLQRIRRSHKVIEGYRGLQGNTPSDVNKLLFIRSSSSSSFL